MFSILVQWTSTFLKILIYNYICSIKKKVFNQFNSVVSCILEPILVKNHFTVNYFYISMAYKYRKICTKITQRTRLQKNIYSFLCKVNESYTTHVVLRLKNSSDHLQYEGLKAKKNLCRVSMEFLHY